MIVAADARVPATAAALWWKLPAAQALALQGSSPAGLPAAEAARRLAVHGANDPAAAAPRRRRLATNARRLFNPFVLVLLGAGVLALVTGQHTSTILIAAVLSLSLLLERVQQGRADRAMALLSSRIAPTAIVVRDGEPRPVPVSQVVPGDIVQLAAGALVPADGLLLDSRDLFVQQSSLTGEPFPVDKHAGAPSTGDSPDDCPAAVFAGSSIISGSGTLLVCATSVDSRLGQMAGLLSADRGEQKLVHDLNAFGLLIMRIGIGLVLLVIAAGALLGRPATESLFFALALAVGITPELLPVIVTLNLARGALRLSQQEVIVRNPAAIHGLGAMDVLCTDKTGTLTQARIALAQHVDIDGSDSPRVLEDAWLNSRFESGLRTPLEDAVLAQAPPDDGGWRKLDEQPFDFERRRIAVLVARAGERRLCVKGAAREVLQACTSWQAPDGVAQPWDEDAQARADRTLAALESRGLRVLAVASKPVAAGVDTIAAAGESGLVFVGFAAFLDPPRADAARAVAALRGQGVLVKVLTGDSEAVTRHVCERIGLRCARVLSGPDVSALDERALARQAARADAFCRMDPVQKVRVIRALRSAGRTVGFLGDGINDAPALHAADVGISVDTAAQAARASADLVLMRPGLHVVADAVTEGRRTFSNTRKYLLLGTSSNFGNMASMALAAALLPFLPMLPVQVLLNNLLYDVASAALPLDRVEPEDLAAPQRLDIGELRAFMLAIGPVSSLFDLLLFGGLWLLPGITPEQFRTTWFIESMASQVLAIFVIRTRGAFRPAAPEFALGAVALAVLAVAFVLPATPLAPSLGFVALPPGLYAAACTATLCYLWVLEAAKRGFWERVQRHRGARNGGRRRGRARRPPGHSRTAAP